MEALKTAPLFLFVWFVTTFALVRRRVRGDEFRQAENSRFVVSFAVNFVNTIPRGLLAVGRLGSRQSHFHLESIERATQSDAARFTGSVTVKAVLTGGNNGSLELQNSFDAQTSRVREITGSASHGSHEALVRIHLD